MKDLTKAQRRHDAERVKRNRAGHRLMRDQQTPKAIGMHAATPASCSCHVCGNPRKYRGEVTMQERKFMDVSREYLMGDAA
ncbi:hypothetical protein ACOTHJ_13845 [Achromobacter xylosoxidans]